MTNHLEKALTKEQLSDVLAYDPVPPDAPLFEGHLDEFWWFVKERAALFEWKERHDYLVHQRWSSLSLVDREMIMDEANEEALNNHRIRVMKEVERLNQYATELAMVMGEQVKTLIGNSRIEDIAALEDVTRNHRGFLASSKCNQLPFSTVQREAIMAIPVAGDEDRGTVDLSGASSEDGDE